MKESGVLDKILAEIGNFGVRQIVILVQICLISFLISANHIAFVFTAMDPDYRCFIPGCDGSSPEYDEKWLENAIPFDENKPTKCEMFAILNNSSEDCPASEFDRNKRLQCDSFVFKDNANYLGRELDILCPENKWKLSIIGSVNSAGMFVGLLVSGFVSDRYGRKFVLLGGTFISGIMGILKTVKPSYVMFCVFEFSDQFFAVGTYPCGFVLGTEMVTAEKRRWIGIAIFTFYAFGEVFLGIVSWILKDWRLIIYTLYIPTTLTILFGWSIPESSRWYLSKGEVEKPIKILQKFAESNKKEIPSDLLKNINLEEENSDVMTFMEMMKSRVLSVRFIICCFLWITCAFLYYGLTLNAVNLSENSYLDFCLITLIEVPAYWGANYLMEKIGRKICLSGSYFLAATSCVAYIFVREDVKWLHIITYCLGKFGIAAAFYLVYFVTNECFPTPVRQTSMGICSTLARLGSISSPQIPLLSDIWKHLPLVLFSTVATASGIFSLFLPETVNTNLPDTIPEAESIGKKVKETVCENSNVASA